MVMNGNNAGVPPEVMAVISAGVDMVLKQEREEMMAAVAAAIVHARGGGLAVRIKSSRLWTVAGRMKAVNSRL